MTEQQTTSNRRKVDTNWRLLGYLRPYGPQVLIAYAAMLLGTGLNLIVPKIIAWAIDFGLSEGRASTLIKAGAIIMAIALVRGVLGFAQRYYGEWLTHRVAYD
ncbi:MAG TPA: ABC transporter ATP-binding protein, partial [Promineifilum sp.]|nr:ABC transporter ATP-binding protein [Promineifilum sp.]